MGIGDFDAPNVYYTELSRHSGQWLGHPLWFPDPGNSGEVEIGDVGYVHKGRFLRLFNVVTEEGFDTEKRPESFKPLAYSPRLCDERNPQLNPGPMASSSITLLKGEGNA